MRHAAIFELFPRWEGPLEHDMLIDFLGVRTPYSYDCEGTTPDEMRRAREEGKWRETARSKRQECGMGGMACGWW